MKCEHCGFIAKKDYDVCPYCGHAVSAEDKNILHRTLTLGQSITIRVIGLINVILVNLFAIGLLTDIVLMQHNTYTHLSFYAYAACFGIMTVIQIIYRQKRSPLATFELLDIYVILGFVVAMLEFSIPSNTRDAAAIIFPLFSGYIILSVIAFILLTIFGRGQKFKPLPTEYLLILHFLLTLVMFVFYLIEVNKAPGVFSWMIVGETPSVWQGVLTYGAFGASTFFFVNFNIILIKSIVSKVKYIYGK